MTLHPFLRRARWIAALPLLLAVSSCGSNTGFELVINVNPQFHVPADYDSIFVQIVPQQNTGNGLTDNTTGQTFPLKSTDQQPYVVVVLQTGTQYTQASQIMVQLMKTGADGKATSFLGASIVGDRPFQQGQLTTVVMPTID